MIAHCLFEQSGTFKNESQAISGCGADPGARRADAKRNSRILVKTKKCINLIERNLRLMRLGKYLSSLTKPELEELRDLLNLSDDEYPIFEELSHGRSKVYISDQCKICVSTVDNRIRAIRKKLERLQNGGVTGG